MINLKPLAPLALLLPALALGPGCAGLAIGAGAATVSAATQERGIKGTITDTSIRASINALWLDHDADLFLSVELSVVEGKVLLTGHVQKPDDRVQAVRLAWKADGVREVINEIRVADSRGISGYSRDSWITAKLRKKILFDRKVASVNYTIDTVGGIIYLMGIAQDAAELNRVKAHARDVAYAKRVVSYVVLKTDPARKEVVPR